MITEIIKPIQLLSGSHNDTAQTGQGGFMNVIAYLNGEPQITDQSDCVCYVVRPIAIWLNDYLQDDERNHLIPFIERAMGSRTEDKAEVSRRLALVVDFANQMQKYAAKYVAKYSKTAEYADSAAKCAKYAAECAKCAAECAKYVAKYSKTAEYAEYAAEYAAKCAKYAKYAAASAVECAKYAAECAKYAATRKAIIDGAFAFLDAVLPQRTDHAPAVTERAKTLVAITTT